MDWQEHAKKLQGTVTELREELRILRATQSGDIPSALSYLQMKADRQRKALDILNRKVTSQRFYLRVLEELGRNLTKEEYLAAKTALEATNSQKAERLEFEVVG